MKRRLAPHGSITRYFTQKCRCARCRKTAREYTRGWREKNKLLPAKQIPHGINGYENYGCRCKVCSTSKLAQRKEQRKAAMVA